MKIKVKEMEKTILQKKAAYRIAKSCVVSALVAAAFVVSLFVSFSGILYVLAYALACILLCAGCLWLMEKSFERTSRTIRREFSLQYKYITANALKSLKTFFSLYNRCKKLKHGKEWTAAEIKALNSSAAVIFSLLPFDKLVVIYNNSEYKKAEDFMAAINMTLSDLADKGHFGDELKMMKQSVEREYQIRQYLYDNASNCLWVAERRLERMLVNME